MKIGIWFPGLAIESQPADGGGEMDMEITFEVATESMIGRVDTRNEMLLSSKVFNDVGRDRSKFVEKPAIEPEERLKMIRQGESNVLPSGVGESVKGGFDPVIRILFPAGGTKAGFAGMRCLELVEAFWADKDMPAKQRGPTGKHFKYVDNNVFADQLAVGEKKFPPVAVIEEDVPDFDLTADEFHRGTIANLNVGER